MRLNGRVAIVTGGGRGIGRGISMALAREGVDVVVVEAEELSSPYNQYHSTRIDGYKSAVEVADEIKAMGREALAVEADISKGGDVRGMLEKTLDKLGRVDILVNNAGVIWRGPLVEFEEEAWDFIFEINVRGVFLCCKAVAPLMMRQGGGRIINISSVAGKRASPRSAAYSASKFAVIGLTQALAFELAPYDVTVNAICPGIVNTMMWRGIISPQFGEEWGVSPEEAFDRVVNNRVPLGRPQTADDIGDLVVFLCKSDNITGQSINVDGGIRVH
ncbi:MAG: SDR family NAD(P)-dependent oxidoreductase [Candidatus Bathyarchaeia archaeon]